MEEIVTVLDFGVIEHRFYENGKLVDIRKEYPSDSVDPGFGHRRRGLSGKIKRGHTPGASGE